MLLSGAGDPIVRVVVPMACLKEKMKETSAQVEVGTLNDTQLTFQNASIPT